MYWYDNKSRWEELDTYNYWGGGAADEGTYYRAEQDAYIYDGQPYKYRFKPIAYTSEIGQYRDSDGYICITDTRHDLIIIGEVKAVTQNVFYFHSACRLDERVYSANVVNVSPCPSKFSCNFKCLHPGISSSKAHRIGNDSCIKQIGYLLCDSDTHFLDDLVNEFSASTCVRFYIAIVHIIKSVVVMIYAEREVLIAKNTNPMA